MKIVLVPKKSCIFLGNVDDYRMTFFRTNRALASFKGVSGVTLLIFPQIKISETCMRFSTIPIILHTNLHSCDFL